MSLLVPPPPPEKKQQRNLTNPKSPVNPKPESQPRIECNRLSLLVSDLAEELPNPVDVGLLVPGRTRSPE